MEDASPILSQDELAEPISNFESAVDSVTLARLLEEVRNADAPLQPTSYNRMHNRHNRS